MNTWSQDTLRKIAEADDLRIASFREDGETNGTPTWIWSAAVDDALYVRGYHGKRSRWYQAAVSQKLGRIIAAGMTLEVSFESIEGPINDRIDDAYRGRRVSSRVRRLFVSRPNDQCACLRRNRPDLAAQKHLCLTERPACSASP